jgi:HEPN domain-containing protein
LRFNPGSEAEYRQRLAKEFLDDAEGRFQATDFRGCVQFSQLAAENAAKAVVATKRTPSWAHDPSPELLAVSGDFDAKHGLSINRLAEIVSTLAPEHGRTVYGEPERFATPKSLYDSDAARRALDLAKEAFELMKGLLREANTR